MDLLSRNRRKTGSNEPGEFRFAQEKCRRSRVGLFVDETTIMTSPQPFELPHRFKSRAVI